MELSQRHLWIILSILVATETRSSWSNTSAEWRTGQERRQSGSWCVPQAWQGGRGITQGIVDNNGTSTITRTYGYVTYSATLQKMSTFDISIPPGGSGYLWRIFDYPANILYWMTDAITCNKVQLPGSFHPLCIPENATATFVKSTYGAEQNAVSAMELAGLHNDVSYRVSVSQTTHMPIFTEWWGGHDGRNFFQTISYYNVSIHDIPDIVFKPPDICLNATASSESGGEKLQTPFLSFSKKL